jgi:four helix bundle protein
VWRKRRYQAGFIGKLSDAESEAAQTQVWIEFAVKCNYLNHDRAEASYQAYADILRTLVGMITHPETWIISDER